MICEHLNTYFNGTKKVDGQIDRPCAQDECALGAGELNNNNDVSAAKGV